MTRAVELLTQRGAGGIEHPGGTLLDHLLRVADRLAGYGASEPLRLAGLTHAAYSTDGFDTALLTLQERPQLAEAIGPEAEQLVYRYGATDRRPFYRQVDQPLIVWTDRFTQSGLTLDAVDAAPLLELTVANELDVVEHSEELLHAYGDGLLTLFTRGRRLLSIAAWADVERVL